MPSKFSASACGRPPGTNPSTVCGAASLWRRQPDGVRVGEMDVHQMVRNASARFSRGQAAYFLGAGVSQPSGLPSWLDLLAPVAEERLGISVTEGDDLPAVAQYIVNANSGNRRPLVDRFLELTERRSAPNAYHHSIRRTAGANLIWTTNYDDIIEKALDDRTPVVRHNDASLIRGMRSTAIEVVKVHGCIRQSDPDDLVITAQDYEDFEVRRPALAQRLRSDLLARSFVFVGYSYGDPNIRTALVQARRLLGRTPPQHFMLTRRPTDAGPLFDHWCEDLARVGIAVSICADYVDIEKALDALARASKGKTVYVTGSHTTPDTALAAEVGRRLAEQSEITLLDGQSDGTGRAAVESFSRACVSSKQDLTERLRTFLNPYAINPRFGTHAGLLPELQALRSELLASARVVIAFPGGMGTEAEVSEAARMGATVLPVPLAHGDSSDQLLKKLASELPEEYVDAAGRFRVTADRVVKCAEALMG